MRLKPCPFCGGVEEHHLYVASLVADGHPDKPQQYVRCRSCCAEGPWAVSESVAVMKWNGLRGTPRGDEPAPARAEERR